MLTKYIIYNYFSKSYENRLRFIPFNGGFRTDTGLQFPPILSPEPLLPIPLFKPSKLRKYINIYRIKYLHFMYIILHFHIKF